MCKNMKACNAAMYTSICMYVCMGSMLNFAEERESGTKVCVAVRECIYRHACIDIHTNAYIYSKCKPMAAGFQINFLAPATQRDVLRIRIKHL